MKKLLVLASMFALPLVSSAQVQSVTGQITNFDDIIKRFGAIGNVFISIIITLAILYIVYNVFRYLIAGGEEEKKKGGMAILYGVVGLFVILSIWGLVRILTRTFDTGDNNSVQQGELPQLPIRN